MRNSKFGGSFYPKQNQQKQHHEMHDPIEQGQRSQEELGTWKQRPQNSPVCHQRQGQKNHYYQTLSCGRRKPPSSYTAILHCSQKPSYHPSIKSTWYISVKIHITLHLPQQLLCIMFCSKWNTSASWLALVVVICLSSSRYHRLCDKKKDSLLSETILKTSYFLPGVYSNLISIQGKKFISVPSFQLLQDIWYLCSKVHQILYSATQINSAIMAF